MKINRVLVAIFLAAIICVPGMIAISYYNNIQNNPVSKNAISTLKLIAPNGTEYLYKKGDSCSEASLGEDLIAYFVGLNERAVYVTELPELATAQNRFTVAYTSYNKETSYQYYFTTNPQYAYMVDQNNTVYRIAEQDAVAFLKSSYSYCLYSASAAPVFRVGESEVLPSTILWQYASYDNEYHTVPSDTTEEICEISIRNSLDLLFDNQPDYTNVRITSQDVILYDGQPSGIPTSLFQNSAYYTVTVQAKWFRDTATNESFGEANYQFHAKILAPAVFYLSETEIDPGEFVIITGKNVEDLSQIGFTATPVIDYTPVFFKDGEYVRALIPISIALEEIPSEVSFRLSYAGREQTMQLKIKEKTFRSQTYDASATLIATTRSEAAFNEFNNTIVPILNTYTQARYFDNTKFANPSGSAQIRTGFGLYRTLTSINETYRHEGVDYVIWSKNQPALATMSGKVVYVGNLSLTGRVVVIDHGFGLHSLYAHLASTTVSVGDIVQKNDQIGVCGSTGFTTDTNLHFGLYVGDVPVSPYRVFSKGAQMTEYTESEQ